MCEKPNADKIKHITVPRREMENMRLSTIPTQICVYPIDLSYNHFHTIQRKGSLKSIRKSGLHRIFHTMIGGTPLCLEMNYQFAAIIRKKKQGYHIRT